jgi:hypothetical protein
MMHRARTIAVLSGEPGAVTRSFPPDAGRGQHSLKAPMVQPSRRWSDIDELEEQRIIATLRVIGRGRRPAY